MVAVYLLGHYDAAATTEPFELSFAGDFGQAPGTQLTIYQLADWSYDPLVLGGYEAAEDATFTVDTGRLETIFITRS